MQPNLEDEGLVAIIEAVGMVADITDWGLIEDDRDELSEEQQKKKKIKERGKYVDKLVYLYIGRYIPTHDNRPPPKSLFAEAIKVYVNKNCNGNGTADITRNSMRELILGSLAKYGAQLRDSYN